MIAAAILNLEILQQRLIIILRSEAGISQILSNRTPILETSTVEHLQIFVYDEWDNAK